MNPHPVPYVAVSRRPPGSYVVTAINRLTRTREPVTPPCSMENAERILQREKSTPPRKRSYIYPNIERFTTQTEINFKKYL